MIECQKGSVVRWFWVPAVKGRIPTPHNPRFDWEPSLAMPAPTELMPLPESATGIWTAQVRESFTVLQNKYQHAARILHQTQSEEPTRLLIIAEELNSQGSRLLDVMAAHHVPEDWIEAAALCCSMLLTELETAIEIGRGRQVLEQLS